jgi:dipeptidyl aminopeptidase/acylaminoacyl peptidase
MRSRLTRPILVGAVALALISTGFTASAPAATTTIPAPPGLPAFYAVPLPIPTMPGKLMKAQLVTVTGLHGTMYRVMYSSKTVYNQPVAVTGVIAVPSGTPPTGGFPVVSWGHGTNGMADTCAPSLKPGTAIPLVNTLLDRRWVVTASDYQGEGTPGLMPYIAGGAAARNTIDIVKAARELTAAHASTQYVVWGHSEGGHTAMFSLKIAAAHAPQIQLKGVVAGAPPSQFGFLYNALKDGPFRHYLLMAAGGLNAAYGNTAAPLGQILTPLGLQQIPKLDKGCIAYLIQQFGTLSTASVVKADPFTVPAWNKLLMANDPANFSAPRAAPLLIIQGGNDEQIPVVSTELLANQLCAVGQVLQRWVYPGQSHAGVIGPSANDMIQWISHRFAGGTNPDPYVPTGLPGIDVKVCG